MSALKNTATGHCHTKDTRSKGPKRKLCGKTSFKRQISNVDKNALSSKKVLKKDNVSSAAASKLNTQAPQCVNETTKLISSSASNVQRSGNSQNVHSTQRVWIIPSKQEQLISDSALCHDNKESCSEQNTTKNEKSENHFENFKIPKKKKVSEKEETLPFNQSVLHTSSNIKRNNRNKWKQANSMYKRKITQLNQNRPDNSVINAEEYLRNNDQNSKKNAKFAFKKNFSSNSNRVTKNGQSWRNNKQNTKRMRFAKGKGLLSMQQAASNKHTLKNNSNSYSGRRFFNGKQRFRNSDWNQKKKARVAKETLHAEPRRALSTSQLAASTKYKSLEKNSLRIAKQHPSFTTNYNSPENMLVKILHWKPNWLEEQQKYEKPPPFVKYMPVVGRKQIYFKLLLLEIWQSIYEAWQNCENCNANIDFAVIRFQPLEDMMLLKCQAVIPPVSIETIRDGQLAILEISFSAGSKETTQQRIFGYICDCKIERYTTAAAHPLLQVCSSSAASSHQLINFILSTKLRGSNLKFSTLMKMQLVGYMNASLHHCEALQNMDSSTFHRWTFNAQHKLCLFDEVSQNLLKSIATYSEVQRQSILDIAAAIFQSKGPRLLLLRGPSGTGKTHTVLGIIQQLLFHQDNTGQPLKILVVADSDAAIDEIGCRLLKLNSALKASNAKEVHFVRVGQNEMVHIDLKKFLLDEQVKSKLQHHNPEQDIENAFTNMQEKINKLEQEISSRLEDNSHDSVIQLKKKELANARENCLFFEENFGKHECRNEKQKHKLKTEVLTEANLVLTTLNNCHKDALGSSFGENRSITCCIIDNVIDCKESEILIPLQLGINKVLLVGATMLSKKAADHGFLFPLFERLNRKFKDSSGENPVFILTDQYRMHPEIYKYPSSHFYSDHLKSCRLGEYFTDFPLKRYMILDIVDDTHNQRSSFNLGSVNFIKYLCIEILRLIPSSCNVGILTPHQEQREYLKKYFQCTISQEQHRLEVNMIDGFRGREFDVIILSCVTESRNTENISFLNVNQELDFAITRARHSLIICGHMESLRSNNHWGNLIKNAESRNLIFPVKSSTVEKAFDLVKAKTVNR